MTNTEIVINTCRPVVKSHKGSVSELNRDRALVFSDTHFGYRGDQALQNEEFLNGLVTLAKKARVGTIVVAGDVLDLSDWSLKYLAEPEIQYQTQRAIEAASVFLAKLTLTGARVVVLSGNHDIRLEKLVASKLPQVYGLRATGQKHPVLSLQNLLGTVSLGIEVVGSYPSGSVDLGNWVVFHGHKASSAPGRSASEMLKGSTKSVISGHTHRREVVTSRLGREVLFSINPGCCCHTDGRVPGSNGLEGWVNGAVIVEGKHFEFVDSERGAVWRGKLYR